MDRSPTLRPAARIGRVGTLLAIITVMVTALPGTAALETAWNLRYQKIDGVPRARQCLDIYFDGTKRDAKVPVLIWIHGGAWRFGTKEHVTVQKAKALHKAGIVLVAVNYRFHPDVTYKQQASDIAAALQWTQVNIAKYGGDPNRLALMGHSAGAHLAALTAIDQSYLRQAGVKAAGIKAVILLDGAGYDIPLQIKSARARSADLYKTVFTEDPAKQKAASPITHVRKGTDYPDFLIIPCAHRPDSTAQSKRLSRALRATGASAKVSPAEGKTHMTLNREWGQDDDDPTTECLEFLERPLAPKAGPAPGTGSPTAPQGRESR